MRSNFLQYYRPHIDDGDISSVTDSLRNGWLTTGPNVRKLEAEFVETTGVKHAVAVNSCTAALHLALVAFGVGAGDEVIMPALTFVAGAECVRQLGAEPVFCDVDAHTLCITPATIEAVVTPRTKLIISMQYGGQPARIEAIVAFAKSRGIPVLEDAAHAVGTLDSGEWPGRRSDAAALSFYATKNITSAEGGLLLTNRDDVAEKVRILSLHGMDRDAWKRYTKGGTWQYDVVAAGYKYNMPDLAASLALTQMKKLEKLQGMRERLAAYYCERLSSVAGVQPVASPLHPPDRHSWCIFAVTVDEDVTLVSRNDMIDELRKRNIGTSVHFIPTHQFSAYRDSKKGDLHNTEAVSKKLISLPLYPGMVTSDVDDVISAMTEIIGEAHDTSARRTERIAT